MCFKKSLLFLALSFYLVRYSCYHWESLALLKYNSESSVYYRTIERYKSYAGRARHHLEWAASIHDNSLDFKTLLEQFQNTLWFPLLFIEFGGRSQDK